MNSLCNRGVRRDIPSALRMIILEKVGLVFNYLALGGFEGFDDGVDEDDSPAWTPPCISILLPNVDKYFAF